MNIANVGAYLTDVGDDKAHFAGWRFFVHGHRPHCALDIAATAVCVCVCECVCVRGDKARPRERDTCEKEKDERQIGC